MSELNNDNNAGQQGTSTGGNSAEGTDTQSPTGTPNPPATGTENSQGENTDQQENNPEVWKQRSRDWEKKAKANKAAADELAQLKQSQMSDADKAAEKLRLAEENATKATAKAARLELAVKHGLSEDDADLLEGITDVEAMERIAKRFATAAQQESNPRTPRPNPNQGKGTPGAASNADLFAAAIGQHFQK